MGRNSDGGTSLGAGSALNTPRLTVAMAVPYLLTVIGQRPAAESRADLKQGVVRTQFKRRAVRGYAAAKFCRQAGGDGAEKRAALEQNEARPVDESARGKRFSCTQLAAGVIGV